MQLPASSCLMRCSLTLSGSATADMDVPDSPPVDCLSSELLDKAVVSELTSPEVTDDIEELTDGWSEGTVTAWGTVGPEACFRASLTCALALEMAFNAYSLACCSAIYWLLLFSSINTVTE